jgi:hypothetical protein
MRRVLENLADGLPAADHLRGMSQHGGFNNTRAALIARGWMTLELEITQAGREMIGRSEPTT